MPQSSLLDALNRLRALDDGSVRYWHGGAPGRMPGELLLPAAVTGTPFATDRKLAGVGRPLLYRPDLVYVTTSIDNAIVFAGDFHGGVGAVFEVAPVGELERDVDDGWNNSFTCETARVIREVPVDVRILRRIRAVKMDLVKAGGRLHLAL